ncbi:MAG: hypothetical protein DMG10_00915 [Acidobacteria bacterium]|nr:MAG: hypothetical protein DMG10_00915 [Acidobacteriota bacterium]
MLILALILFLRRGLHNVWHTLDSLCLRVFVVKAALNHHKDTKTRRRANPRDALSFFGLRSATSRDRNPYGPKKTLTRGWRPSTKMEKK